MNESATGARAWRACVGLLLLAYSLVELRIFLQDGLPLFFDAHSHLTRSWLAARALEAGRYPTWTFEWYGGYRLFEFYSPAYYLLCGGLGSLLGDVALATKLLLFTGQAAAVVAFYACLCRIGASPLAALFGALFFLHDPQRWRVLAVIGNYPTLFVYVMTPLVMLMALRVDGTRRTSVRAFAAGSLLLAAMAFGHGSNALQVLPSLAAFALVSWLDRFGPAAAGRALAGLAATLFAFAIVTAGLSVPILRDLQLVTLSLESAGIAWNPEPLTIALGFGPGSMQRIFVATPGAAWSVLALAAGCLSLRTGRRRFRACSAGLAASLLSIALFGERAVIGLVFFVASLCTAALEIAVGWLQPRARRTAATLLEVLAVAAVLLWHHTRDETPLRYVAPESLAIYQRIPRREGLARTFDVTPATDSVDGVYGRSSFSPYWTGRAIPFGAFPQGAPLASNLQLALVGKLVTELAAAQPELSEDALDLLTLLDVEWLVDRNDPPRLARLAQAAHVAELVEPGLLKLRHATPALFATHLELLPADAAGGSGPGAPALLARLEAQWAKDPLTKRGQRSLDALSRSGMRRDWDFLLPFLRGMRIERARAVADRFFVEKTLDSVTSPQIGAGEFAVLAHEAGLVSVKVMARASAPGFVRLAYSFDPDLELALDGEPTAGVPDFLGAVVLPFPEGTHEITLRAPPATLRLRLLEASGLFALALAGLWAWARWLGPLPR